jgi:hypothetical protein
VRDRDVGVLCIVDKEGFPCFQFQERMYQWLLLVLIAPLVLKSIFSQC